KNRRGEDAFGKACLNRIRLLAAPKLDAKREVARLRARTGQQKVAKTGKPHHCFGLAAIRSAEAHELSKAPRGQRRQRACAKTASGDHACGNGKHVFGRAAELDAANVVGMIRAEGR